MVTSQRVPTTTTTKTTTGLTPEHAPGLRLTLSPIRAIANYSYYAYYYFFNHFPLLLGFGCLVFLVTRLPPTGLADLLC